MEGALLTDRASVIASELCKQGKKQGFVLDSGTCETMVDVR